MVAGSRRGGGNAATPLPGARQGKRGQGVHRGLTLQVVLDQALLIAVEQGRAGLSMRRLAEALGVQAMSLYHYVPDKATLMALMADRSAIQVLAGIDDNSDLPWPEQLTALAINIFAAAVRNPAFADALTTTSTPVYRPASRSPQTPVAPLDQLLIRITTLLENTALTRHEITHARDGLIDLVVGSAARAYTSAAAGPDLKAGIRFAVTAYLAGISAVNKSGQASTRASGQNGEPLVAAPTS